MSSPLHRLLVGCALAVLCAISRLGYAQALYPHSLQMPLFALDSTGDSPCLSRIARFSGLVGSYYSKAYVAAILRQPNGGTIFAGTFTRATPALSAPDWTALNSAIRMRPDGSWDRIWHLDIRCDDAHKEVSLSALASDSAGNIYVGGLFATPGGDGHRNLARFNAQGELDASWRMDTNGEVSSLTMDEDENLFVAGSFTQIGGVQRPYLAKIRDGKVIEEWSPTISAPVSALAITNSSIFAGSYAYADQQDNLVGSALIKLSRTGNGQADPGWTVPIRGLVYALALDHQGYLYAGGSFHSIGDALRGNIARFSVANGDLDQNWMAGETDGFRERLGFPLTKIAIPVQAIAIDSKNNVFVGGVFDRSSYTSDGSARGSLAKIDTNGKFDMTWGTHAFSNSSYVNSLLMENDKLYVGGQIYSFADGYGLVRVLPTDTLNLNQQGLSGSWGRSDTPGTRQGFLLNVYPDNVAPGRGTIFAGWYTYDAAGGSGSQRWYALQGDVDGNDNSGMTTLGIYTAIDGNLGSGPKPTNSKVGKAMLTFSDCSTGTLTYEFDDGRLGFIPLSRVTGSTTCGAHGSNGSDPANSLLAGTWIVPDAVGMGFVIDISPASQVLLGSWYTFFPANHPVPSPRQQWFVFQANSGPSTTAWNDVDLLQSNGGTFDATVGGGVTTTVVGKVNLAFTSCTTATFTYAIPTESVNQNTVNLVRLGPAPAGCKLP